MITSIHYFFVTTEDFTKKNNIVFTFLTSRKFKMVAQLVFLDERTFVWKQH